MSARTALDEQNNATLFCREKTALRAAQRLGSSARVESLAVLIVP